MRDRPCAAGRSAAANAWVGGVSTQPAAPSDAELLSRWRQSDKQAGSALVERHFTAVYRFLRRRIGDTAVARDLAQQTFLTLVESSGAAPEHVRMRAWVLGIARNLMLHHWRDLARPASDVGEPQSVATPSQAVGDQQARALVRRAIAALPDELRMTLELHYWDELTTAEVAAVLEAPVGTIKWRLSRARELLRAAIVEHAGDARLVDATLRGLDRLAREVGSDDDGAP